MVQPKTIRLTSLIELAVAVAALAIVAMLSVPQFSQASSAPVTAPLQAELDLLRNAIERYCYDHVAWPGRKGDGTHGSGTAAAFVTQLTKYTDADGIVSPTRSERFCYGPYLLEGVPDCPVGSRRGTNDVLVVNDVDVLRFDASHPDFAWLFNCRTGTIVANTDEVDTDGVRYDEY